MASGQWSVAEESGYDRHDLRGGLTSINQTIVSIAAPPTSRTEA